MSPLGLRSFRSFPACVLGTNCLDISFESLKSLLESVRLENEESDRSFVLLVKRLTFPNSLVLPGLSEDSFVLPGWITPLIW